jgi:hypothetical protein
LPRLLTEQEVSAYSRFLEYIAQPDKEKFVDQLRRIEVMNEDTDHMTFGELKDADGIEEFSKGSLMAFYDDEDGETVHMTLAFVPPGVISWLDRYRVDHRPVQNPSPRANEIRFFVQKPEK